MDERTLNDLLECSVCLERLDTTSKVRHFNWNIFLKTISKVIFLCWIKGSTVSAHILLQLSRGDIIFVIPSWLPTLTNIDYPNNETEFFCKRKYKCSIFMVFCGQIFLESHAILHSTKRNLGKSAIQFLYN